MPTPCTVTGNLQTLSSGQINAGAVRFQLSNTGTGNPVGIVGTSLIPQLVQTFTTDNMGAFSCAIWGNDNINPANTVYLVTFLDGLGNSVGPIQYSITGGSVNLNTAIAGNTTSPPVLIGGPAIVSAPLAPQTITGQPLTLTSAPLTLTNTGVYTNTQANEYMSSALGGINISTEFSSVQGGQHQTDAVAGGVSVPVGATVLNANAIAGYAVTSADSASRTKANTTPLYGQCRNAANNSACWGLNQVVFDAVGLTGHAMTGDELDMNLLGSPAFFKGFYLTGLNQGGTLPASATGFEIATPYRLPVGFICDRASAAVGLQLNDSIATNPSISQALQFISHDSGGGAHIAQLNSDANGNLVGTSNGAQQPLGITGNTAGTHTDSGFYQTASAAGCTTAASIGGVCASPVTITWPVAFTDTNYKVQCAPSGTITNLPGTPNVTARNATTATVNYFAISAAAASWGTIECIAVHN